MTALELPAAAVAYAVGRQLTASEEAIDVARLDRALARAKDDLNAAIHDEMLRAVLVWIANGASPRLSVTPTMRQVLDGLYDLGAEEAWLELERLGYELPRRYIEEAPGEDRDVPGYLTRNLRGIEVRIEDDLVRTDLARLSSAAVARAVMQIPGARDLASRAISTALINGFASTFDQVADLVGRWQYTAILDGGTCDICRPLDGTVYDTLEELFRVLPGYGPNPRCLGGGRCRCRAVPMPADYEPPDPTTPVLPAPSSVEDTMRLPARSIHGDVLAEITTARAAIAGVHQLPPRAPNVPVRIRNMREGVSGHFNPNPDPPEIVINASSPSPSLTLAHEFGHAIDWHFLGAPDGMATEQIAPALRGLFDALASSDAVTTLIDWLRSPPTLRARLPDGRLIEFVAEWEYIRDYLLIPPELFARAYAQWVAVRSGDRTMLAQLDERRQEPYPLHWSDDDFEPIAAAFDALAREQGWISSTTS